MTASQALALGWVPPLGEESGPLVHAAAGRLLLRMRREEKLLPAAVVREQLQERIAAIESAQGRVVYRRERLSLKDVKVPLCAVACETDHIAAWIAHVREPGSGEELLLVAQRP